MKKKIKPGTDLNKIESADNKNGLSIPLYGLPDWLQHLAITCADVYGSPIEFFLTSFLCAIGSALRKQVCVNNGKYINYPQLWVMLVAPSGTGKSEPLKIAYRPLQELDKESYSIYDMEYQQWEQEANQKKSNKSEELLKPLFRQLLIGDATPEALYSTMAQNGGAITHYVDELSALFGDVGRYNASGEIAKALSMFDNADFSINRKTQKAILIPSPFYMIAGTIQPKLLRSYAKKNNLDDNGMLPRFLFVYPDNLEYPPYSREKVPPEQLKRYDDLIRKCYQFSDSTVTFHLSEEANLLYEEFVMKENKPYIDSLPIMDEFNRSLRSKMNIHILRLALIIEVIHNLDSSTKDDPVISKSSMKYAIELIRFYADEAIKIYTLMESKENNMSCIGNEELIVEIGRRYQIKNKQLFADSIGISRPFISKILNKK
ncbi:DUF3987 domain-containing protein [Paludibacteraceae bacterium OttesenSCG-928-F17]|nr:DUF3987 domain-containing protein [Paludibacteraceae bacterium OttesenSCG-928-F17]